MSRETTKSNKKKTNSSLSSEEKHSTIKAPSSRNSFSYRQILTYTSLIFLPILLSYVIYHDLVLQQNSKILFASTSLFATTNNNMAAANNDWKNAQSIYEFKAKDIDGNEVDFSKYKYFKY